ncbi:MAG: efflux transporter outer membrane subunit, partial [Limisphaerales bacterium]
MLEQLKGTHMANGTSQTRRANLARRILVLGPLCVLAGCMVGPNYHRPQVNVPAHWSEPLAGGETNTPPHLADWWKVFDDPQLDSLVSVAVRSNLQVRAAAARVREARALRSEAAGGLWPAADASGSYTRNRMSANSFIPLPPGTPLNYNLYQVGFDASWELDIFGGTRRAVQAATASVAAAELNRRDVLVSLIAETARNYFQLRGAQQRLAIARENIAAEEQSLKLTRERYQAGLSSQLDVEQAQALLAATEATLPTLETVEKAAAHRLAVLL